MPQLAKLFRALADPNRLRIINLLSERDLCVCDLQRVLGLAQPFISRHLAYLRQAGLVDDRREGARVCYSLRLSGPLGEALRSLLLAAVRDSITFQRDLSALFELASAGRLKSGVAESGVDPRASQAA